MGHILPFSFAQNTHLTMNAFILLACVAASSAQYVAHPYVHGVAGAYPAGVAAGAYPYAYAGAPVAAPIPAPVAPSSQFQAQDEFGNVQYGYANLNSQKHEVGNTYGGVQGSYSYVDANGVVQTTNYIADGLGFRVQATNLPVAPVVEGKAPVHEYTLPVAPVYEGVAPEPVQDTPEVAAAKAEHLALLEAATAERRRRSTPTDTEVLEAPEPITLAAAPVVAPYAGLPLAGAYAGLPFAGAYAAGHPYAAHPGLVHPGVAHPALVNPYAGAVVASAPATRDATLTTIKLNPGHATAYIVN